MLKKILEELNLDFSQCAAIGDYFNDKNLLENVGLSFKPKDAHRDLKLISHLIKKAEKQLWLNDRVYYKEK